MCTYIIRLLIFGILITLFFSCKQNSKSNTIVSIPPSIEPTAIEVDQSSSKPIKDFPFAVSLKDKDQKSHLSSDILQKNEKPTVMLFWLTTCNPCSKELASIKLNYDQWQSEVPFNLVAMSEDREENYPAFIQRVNNELWPFSAYWDYNRDFKSLMPGSLNGLPQTFIFNKKGKLIWQKKGYLPGWENEIFDQIKVASRS